jgi:biotin carboxyl carrier protein
MFRNKKTAILTLAILVMMIAWVTAAGVVEQKGVLAGQVSAGGLVTPGTMVHEGDVLVCVDTITGPSPALRATTDGKVSEVLVKPGDSIHSGDVLVRVEPARK